MSSTPATANWAVHLGLPTTHPVCSPIPFQWRMNAVGRGVVRRQGFHTQEEGEGNATSGWRLWPQT